MFGLAPPAEKDESLKKDETEQEQAA